MIKFNNLIKKMKLIKYLKLIPLVLILIFTLGIISSSKSQIVPRAKVGKFISDTSFTPTVIKKNGSYYFIARKKESDGKLGKAITTEYKYKR